ncbi:MAG: alpha-amylase family glycosyl hydrolase [Spirochaetales bacterium]
MKSRIQDLLEFIYGPDTGRETFSTLSTLLDRWQKELPSKSTEEEFADGFPLNERDSIIITYGDQFQKKGKQPLEVLGEFFRVFLEGTVTGIHILPFYPYSSDDGFSVMDYRSVHPDWGTWEDIQNLSRSYLLMADLVLNHCSAQSAWFQKFLKGEEPYTRYFISLPPETDVSKVVRPRLHPLLTKFASSGGDKYVWTTFSEDQVDLNYAEPKVLLEMVDILLFYVQKGIRIFRLDAIAYLWKELGTPCIHHPKTHAMVKLFRAIFDQVAPDVLIITETNVPHKENLSYFGEGDEAHMVYQFALPPLLLDAFLRSDSTHLQEWVASIKMPGPGMSFLNFAASHDGIGVLPAQGILSSTEMQGMLKAVEERGGFVSYKATPEGKVPYELNINYFSAISEPTLSEELRIKKFLASQSILLALPGVPGIYIHSLIGSENDRKGAEESGIKRRINREKLWYDRVQEALSTRGSIREQVFSRFEDLLRARIQEPAFHPLASCQVLPTPKKVFALLRTRRPQEEPVGVLCVVNLHYKPVEVCFNAAELRLGEERYFKDLITGDVFYPTWEDYAHFSLELQPFEVLWLGFKRRG